MRYTFAVVFAASLSLASSLLVEGVIEEVNPIQHPTPSQHPSTKGVSFAVKEPVRNSRGKWFESVTEEDVDRAFETDSQHPYPLPLQKEPLTFTVKKLLKNGNNNRLDSLTITNSDLANALKRASSTPSKDVIGDLRKVPEREIDLAMGLGEGPSRPSKVVSEFLREVPDRGSSSGSSNAAKESLKSVPEHVMNQFLALYRDAPAPLSKAAQKSLQEVPENELNDAMNINLDSTEVKGPFPEKVIPKSQSLKRILRD